MNPSLTEALALLNLQPGEVYRTTINGRAVEVRALETNQPAESSDELVQFTDQERIDLWLDILMLCWRWATGEAMAVRGTKRGRFRGDYRPGDLLTTGIR